MRPSLRRTLLSSTLCLCTILLLIVAGVPATQLALAQTEGDTTKTDQQTKLQKQWQRVPLVSEEQRRKGFAPGGEGLQWIRDIAWSPADTSFLMFTTDVGGVFRSLDGGDSWQITMTGWNARGGTAIAFDPHNPKRVIVGGGNSLDDPTNLLPNGIYLSTDQAASWKQVLPRKEGPDWRRSIVYDASSYDPQLGYTTIAYYVSKYDGIFKTTDGGSTWAQINSNYGGAEIRVHPTKGYVYLSQDRDTADGGGFYKSTDGGKTFTQISDVRTQGIDTSVAAPNNVYITQESQVKISTDAGETFTTLPNQGLPACCTAPILNVTVSPSNPKYMSVWWPGENWQWKRFYSKDGGKTWAESDYGDLQVAHRMELSIAPANVRNGLWAYHPKNPEIIISNGGDWISKSINGGAKYIWHNNGYNGVFVPTFNFSPHAPNAIVMSSKDYGAFYSTNSARSFKYADVSFEFGGYTFGGFALDNRVMWFADDPRIDSQGDPVLKVTTDGGNTWVKPQYAGQDIAVTTNNKKFGLISSADPTNPNIGFIGGWRTTDRGKTWAPMANVENVYTYNPKGTHELYGKNGEDIVVSKDHGDSWQKIATIPGGFRDLAYDHLNNRFWLASTDQVKKYEHGQLSVVAIPQDQYGSVRSQTIAVDPTNPMIVYAGNNRDLWASSNSLVRSIDGGNTWENLTVASPLINGKLEVTTGAREVWWIRVHPQTREVWMATSCFGIWKFPAPEKTKFLTGTGLRGDYYNSTDFSGDIVHSRIDTTLNLEWGSGSPAPGVNADNFSVRWLGQVQAPQSGEYTFTTVAKDGVRLWVNKELILDRWSATTTTTKTDSKPIYLSAGQKYSIKIEYFNGSGSAEYKLQWSYADVDQRTIPTKALYVTSSVPGYGDGTGLKGEYFATKDLQGPVIVTRTDPHINFDWGDVAPDEHMYKDGYSIRWTGQIHAPADGAFTFSTLSDDGIRLWVNGQLLIDNWTGHGPTPDTAQPITLEAGKKYDIKLEYFEDWGGATIQLFWSYPGLDKQIVPQEALYPA